jgi:Protein of unknown function (DUF3365)
VSRRCSVVVVLAATLLLGACSPSPKPRPAPSASASARVRAERVGRSGVARLRSALMRRVVSAVKKGGVGAAIDACAGDAQRITAQVNRDLGPKVFVKRTSLRVRNPANAPDAVERRALKKLAALHGRSGAPTHLLEREQRPAGAVYRLFVPIRMVGLCAKCHGPAAGLSPAVQAVLQKRYPTDQATGYQAGDLRGMFSVTIGASSP